MGGNHPNLPGFGSTTPTGMFGSTPFKNTAEMLSRPFWTYLDPIGPLPRRKELEEEL